MIFRVKKSIISVLIQQARKHSKINNHFITTPIFYANAKPHIGHLYTAVLADTVSRYKKLCAPETHVHFMTGTDEHGLKIHQASKNSNLTEQNYVDHISEMYRNLFNAYNVNYSDFLRTTESRHRICVITLWNTLFKKGFIYEGEYEGWYCVADEAFIPESQIEKLADGSNVTTVGKRPVDFVKETNYKFRLSSFKDALIKWLKGGNVVCPETFQNLLLSWVEEGSVLTDISVSRPSNRVPWGIPVPQNPSQTIYVWLDALSCYLTSCGYPERADIWPPTLQVIGKDILKFHGIFWPAFLIGAGLPPPEKLLCHSHWTVNGEKMSKSKGNVVDPSAEAEKYTTDGFRYFLLREGVPHSDGNYTSIKVQRILNSELADTLGNLLNRCTGKLVNANQVFPAFEKHHFDIYCKPDASNLITSIESLSEKVSESYDRFEFYKGIDSIISTLHLANQFFEKKKPWELRKDPKNCNELNSILHLTMETLRICGILLSPVIPDLSSRLLTKLNISHSERTFNHINPLSWQSSERHEEKLDAEKLILYSRLKL